MEDFFDDNWWVADIETYVNCFSLVCLNVLDRTKWLKFVIYKDSEETEYDGYEQLIQFLKTKPSFVGYNWLGFDSQVLESIYRNEVNDASVIYNIAQETINLTSKNAFAYPYKPWDLTFESIDLFKIWHFDRSFVSLKQLEFFTRQRGIYDLPYEHTKELSLNQVNELIKYNIKDVEFTAEFLDRSKSRIEDRLELKKTYGDQFAFFRSDSSLAEYEFATEIANSLGTTIRKLKDIPKAQYEEINIKDLLFDYYKFISGEAKSIYNDFSNFVLKKNRGEFILKRALEKDVKYKDANFHYGLGGAHYCVESGDYKAGDYMILDIDVSSYYPNLSIQNNVSFSHLEGTNFNEIYESKYIERKKHPKGSSTNRRLKLQLNSTYGKSNEVNSIFYDPKFTCSITVNGQLSLLMLADWIYHYIPGSKMLQLNTDGCTFMFPKDKKRALYKVCQKWESTTKLTLEYASYERMVIRDVNNYWAKTVDGKIKRKGCYAIYEDYINSEAYNKVPSMLVIPSAVNHFLEGKGTIEEYVNGEDNIHEFLQGIKTDRRFNVVLWQAEDNGTVSVKSKITDRYFRYYVANRKIEGKKKIYAGSLYKHWNDGRITGLNTSNTVSVQQYLRSERASLHPELNRQYYIDEAYKLINFL